MSALYLSLFNLVSALGWAFVGYQLFTTLQASNYNFSDGAALWSRVSFSLPLVQSLAVCEVLHAILGLVRSPVFPVFLQVLSRMCIVWGCMVMTDGAAGTWSLYLCIGSWVLVEVPRYLFYMFAVNLKGAPHKIPSVLFFLRYHLFMVLYPSGITGELFVAYASHGDNIFHLATGLFGRFLTFLLLLYVPGSPFMMLTMWRNKKRAYKKRAQLQQSPENSGKSGQKAVQGLVWPVTKVETQERSSTKTNKGIWAASVAGVDAELAAQVEKERNWRFGYGKYVMRNAVLSAHVPDNALQIARDGLGRAYEVFEFVRDGVSVSFKEAMQRDGPFSEGVFETHVIEGDKFGSSESVTDVKVPYGGGKYMGRPYYLGKRDDTVLEGVALKEQLAKWVDYGVIEPSAAEAINLVSLHKSEWLDLSNHYFVLLGATSAMGPLLFLLQHGANVIAVDLDREPIWSKIIAAARGSAGRVIIPVRREKLEKLGAQGKKLAQLSDAELAQVSGCNLLSDTPEIATWLESVCGPQGVAASGKVCVGNYTYLDGALHVQLSLACDGIISRLCAARKANGSAADTAVAFLCTPTDDHIVSQEAYKAAKSAFETSVPGWANAINAVTGGKFLGAPNYKAMRRVQVKNDDLYVVDGIAVAQGPNYALAKRMQHWRAVLAHNEGHVVSSNVAPSTATLSVVHNKQFAAAYGGMHLFRPMEVMYQRTSLAVMGLLLIHDVRNEEAVANPGSSAAKGLRNPLELITYGSFHGGVWRCSFKIDKIGVPSALAFYVGNNKAAVVGGTAAFVAGLSWILTGQFVPFL